MKRQQLSVWGLAALGVILPAAALASGDPPAEKNRLHGIVISKEDGKPVADVPVIMAHAEKGYVYFTDTGLRGGGADERVLKYFIKRNSQHFCTALTDDAGHFTLTNFAAPDQLWNLAAGDAEHGYTLQTGLRPQDYLESPLRIEITKPAFISTTVPATAKSPQAYVGVALAPETPGAEEDAAARVYLYGAKAGQKTVRIGPLPGGHTYRVTLYAGGAKLPYQATLFERPVVLAPGATEEVSLESGEGLTLAGRVTSTNDEPLAQVNVTVKTADGLVIGALTDKDGKYELRGTPPGTHALELLRHAARKTRG